ncbi:MAG: MMPL family transporter [Spirochaetaceae bacterium]|jgi:predicted RND superfamily exporter protein|nr:MMPL family transporter [Spirochaetaceae bacterium]
MNFPLKHPVIVVVVTAFITLFFAAQLPRAELDNNNLRFVPYDDKSRVDSAWIDETFGSSLFILVGLERKYGTVFDADFLRLIRGFSEDVEAIDIVGVVDSLVTTDYISGDAETILVENLVSDDFTGTPAEIDELKHRVNSWSIYDRSLVSDDFSATQIYVPLTIVPENAGDPEVSESFLKIRDMAHERFDNFAEVYVAGIPVVSSTINEAMTADLKYLIPVVIIVILLIVYLPLKRPYFVLMSLLAVLISAVWAIGAMPLFNVKLSVISTVLPVILIAVGNSYGLHVMVHYIEGSGKNFAGMTRAEHTAFVIELVKLVRRPIFLAAITTTVSFIAFCFTSVLPIRDFGAFAAFGVFVSFILSVNFTPAVLILRGPAPLAKLTVKKTSGRVSYNDRIASLFVRITKRKWLIIFITLIVIGVSVYGASKMVTDNVFIEYFKDNTDIVKSDKFIRDKFGGSKVISVAIEADSPEIILHPDTLCAMDGLADYISKMPLVGKVMGFSDFIKRTNQVYNIGETSDAGEAVDTVTLLDKAASVSKNISAGQLVWEMKKLVNYEGASYYEIPADPARYGKADKDALARLIGNYLVMLASDDNSYSNDPLEPTAIKSTVLLRTMGQLDTNAVVNAINDYIAANFPQNIKITVGGGALVEGATNSYVVNSVWVSMIIAFAALFFIVSYFNRSCLAGLIGVIPLIALVLLNFAVMGFLGIKLNIATAMIASVSMGIGIDYTVHFMEAYKREAAAANYEGDFLFNAYRTSGVAIIADAVSTGLGFAVLMLSQFKTLGQFGLLITLSLLMSAVVGLVIIPVILNCLPRPLSGAASRFHA